MVLSLFYFRSFEDVTEVEKQCNNIREECLANVMCNITNPAYRHSYLCKHLL